MRHRVIERDWYEIGACRLDDTGRCARCGSAARRVRRPGRPVGAAAARAS